MAIAWILCIAAIFLIPCTDGQERGPHNPPGLPQTKSERGERGSDGIPGLPGRKGVKGDSGSTPPFYGPTGPTGLPGYPGLPGLDGYNGGMGPSGLHGFKGYKGKKGERGYFCRSDVNESPDNAEQREMCFESNADVSAKVSGLRENILHLHTRATSVQSQLSQMAEQLVRLQDSVRRKLIEKSHGTTGDGINCEEGNEHGCTNVTFPKESELDQYIYASCNVQPNPVLDPGLRQNVSGQVLLWQKRSGGHLNIYVHLTGFSVRDHHDESENHLRGHQHGFHVHEFGDLSNGCQSAGAHYNPFNVNHGGPTSTERHIGDLGNIDCDDEGVTDKVFADPVASLMGEHSIAGKSLVVHADPDDYGMNKDDPESRRTGNAGSRIACCLIGTRGSFSSSDLQSIEAALKKQN